MQLTGIHHLTAISANAPRNHDFYANVLGMRLVKKTVNQDDVSAYHLFYADARGSPGTDLTFFEWPAPRERRGTNSIVRTALRVAGREALEYWAARLADAGVPRGPLAAQDGRWQFAFEDPEGQRLAMIDDGGTGAAHPWARSPVPASCQIRGLGPITMSVPDLAPSAAFASRVLGMREVRSYTDAGVAVQVFAMGDGGPAAELHMRIEPALPPAGQGAGGVHHVAFRVPDDAFDSWVARYESLGVRSSGAIDRFYFRSLYAREPGGILYEIATDGPGFGTDESTDALGERLSLPPFLEPRRADIERGLQPL
jgi:glyoxalase family protein